MERHQNRLEYGMLSEDMSYEKSSTLFYILQLTTIITLEELKKT
jgi:hypothetical protein